MWKIPFTLFIILSSVISGLLFWQWDAYSKEVDLTASKEIASQQVTIKSQSDSLTVNQKFSGLTPSKEFNLSLPEGIESWSCINEDGKECESKDENPLTYMTDSKGSIQLQFNFLIKSNNSPFLYNDWLPSFSEVVVTNSKIIIIDSSRRNGTWVTGVPLIGKQKLDFIDYYVFEGSMANPSLYWQENTLTATQEKHGVTIYSIEGQGIQTNFTMLDKLGNVSPIAVVLTDQFQEANGNGVIVARLSIQPDVLERKLVHTYIKGKFAALPIEQSWLIDLHVTILMQNNSQIAKTNEMSNLLKSKLTEEELTNYLQSVLSSDLPLTAKRLDEILSRVTKKETNFFSLNENEGLEVIPLYFIEKRDISVNDKENKNIQMIYLDDQKLFPFIDTLTALGFQVKILSDNETLLLTKGLNSYRFYVNQNIFIYNEEDYGLLENPLTKVNDQIYIDHQWLTSLFKVTFEEDEQKISLEAAIE